MRFVIGPPPASLEFHPEQGGWRRVRDPGPWGVMMIGSVLGIPLCAPVVFGWSRFELTSLHFTFDASSGYGAFLAPLFFLLLAALFFAGLIVIHELIHLLAAPGAGFTSASMFGIWPSRCMPYADYQGPIPAWRCVVVAAAPFMVLSLAPLLVAFLVDPQSVFWAFVSSVNALCCGGDFLLGVLIAIQVPFRAVVRSHGWTMWWRGAA